MPATFFKLEYVINVNRVDLKVFISVGGGAAIYDFKIILAFWSEQSKGKSFRVYYTAWM